MKRSKVENKFSVKMYLKLLKQAFYFTGNAFVSIKQKTKLTWI